MDRGTDFKVEGGSNKTIFLPAFFKKPWKFKEIKNLNDGIGVINLHTQKYFPFWNIC